MKYNLRCNRNISEKMTKKDFVYDIRPPIQSSRKVGYYNSYNQISFSLSMHTSLTWIIGFRLIYKYEI